MTIEIIVKKQPAGHVKFQLEMQGDGQVRVISSDSPAHNIAMQRIGSLIGNAMSMPGHEAGAMMQEAALRTNVSSRAINKPGMSA